MTCDVMSAQKPKMAKRVKDNAVIFTRRRLHCDEWSDEKWRAFKDYFEETEADSNIISGILEVIETFEMDLHSESDDEE